MSLDAVHELAGPILILAGPGTGKTYTLARRIKYLIEQMQVPPEQITVVTFTGAAAQNMRDRLSDDSKPELYVPYSQQPKLICTLHSFGFRVIRENAAKTGLGENPRVITDERLRTILIADAAQLTGHRRESWRQVAECRQFGNCRPSDNEPKCLICSTYCEILRACCAVDHDEQVLLACRILRDNPDILNRYRPATRHLLVDEYQDINAAQFELIRLMSDGQLDGLFVVGDDDQSIYSWRGGSPEHIRRFEADFGPDATTVPLSKSFRCHPHVLEGALRVVERFDPGRRPKASFEYKTPDGPKIQIHNAPSDAKEAKLVRGIIEQALPSQDVLVLLPTRQFLRAIAQELRAAHIPFCAPLSVPGTGLPLVSVLSSWLADPSDSLSLRRCLEACLDSPASGLPSGRVRKSEKIEEREDAFRAISGLWRKVLDGINTSLWDALVTAKDDHRTTQTAWASLSGLLDLYAAQGDPGAFSGKLFTELSPWRKVMDFLEESTSWVDLASQAYAWVQGPTVRLMTFQGAKGLEAKVVCVIGLEDGVIPKDGSNVPEQARLLFVSMTRAINELHLFHARKRLGAVVLRDQYKGGKPDTERSRFLDVIPREHAETLFHRA